MAFQQSAIPRAVALSPAWMSTVAGISLTASIRLPNATTTDEIRGSMPRQRSFIAGCLCPLKLAGGKNGPEMFQRSNRRQIARTFIQAATTCAAHVNGRMRAQSITQVAPFSLSRRARLVGERGYESGVKVDV